ncbi:MAG TPA: hypothetical protein VL048_17705 [Xanthobacteraceae bacterium]|nr:hypothetical protein [Xanthobacteraceae bacterium]
MLYGASLRGVALVLAFVGGLAAPSAAQSDEGPPIPCEALDTVGTAKMSADGVLTLHLRALRFDSIPARDLAYQPGDPHYEDVKRHLGGIAPGQTKRVPPLCGTDSEP